MEEFIKPILEQFEQFKQFKERVITECNVSDVTFRNWSNGGGMEKKYKPIINRIAEEMYGKKVFEEEEGNQ